MRRKVVVTFFKDIDGISVKLESESKAERLVMLTYVCGVQFLDCGVLPSTCVAPIMDDLTFVVVDFEVVCYGFVTGTLCEVQGESNGKKRHKLHYFDPNSHKKANIRHST